MGFGRDRAQMFAKGFALRQLEEAGLAEDLGRGAVGGKAGQRGLLHGRGKGQGSRAGGNDDRDEDRGRVGEAHGQTLNGLKDEGMLLDVCPPAASFPDRVLPGPHVHLIPLPSSCPGDRSALRISAFGSVRSSLHSRRAHSPLPAPTSRPRWSSPGSLRRSPSPPPRRRSPRWPPPPSSPRASSIRMERPFREWCAGRAATHPSSRSRPQARSARSQMDAPP